MYTDKIRTELIAPHHVDAHQNAVNHDFHTHSYEKTFSSSSAGNGTACICRY
jgi:hypothetical protein